MTDANGSKRCDDCLMRTHGILRDLPQHAFDRMTCCMSTYKFPAGHTVFLEGNPCNQIGSIRSGKIKLSKCGAGGRTLVIGTVGVGFILGYESLLGGRYQSSAETLTEVELCLASHVDILRQMKEHPDVALGLVNFLCSRIEALERKTHQLGTLSARQRLAAYLLSICSVNGDPRAPVNDPPPPPLTRQEIAETLGIARETLIRLLARFEQQRMIRLDGRIVIVNNPDRLRQVLSAAR